MAGNGTPKTERRTLTDFISGQEVADTPEERVVQSFTHLLVEKYGYAREQIHTRPQWHVPQSPSEAPRHVYISEDDAGGRKRSHPGYPIEVVVFDDPRHYGSPDHVVILGECKEPGTKLTDTLAKQLRTYMGLQLGARIGVFFNGTDQRVFYKYGKNGDGRVIEIPDLPARGEEPDLGGRRLRRDLHEAVDLKRKFEEVRNYIHSEDPRITRDEDIIKEIVSLLICKIYDETNGKADGIVEFRWSPTETDEAIFERVNRLYGVVRDQVPEVFDPKNDLRLNLAPKCVAYFVKKVHPYRLSTSGKDAVGEAFETFIGDALKGKEGQYFTPRNVVDMMVRFLNPKPTDRIIDPACGTGGFLVAAMRQVFDKIQEEQEGSGRLGSAEGKQQAWARTHLFGIDKDSLCTRFSKAYLAILGDGASGLFCKDSLDFQDWSEEMKRKLPFGSFDIVLTNPPFGEDLVKGRPIVNEYDLGHEWKKIGKTDQWEARPEPLEEQENSILFLELCLKLLKKGGKLGIVFPETHCASPGDGYLWSWLLPQYKVLGIVDIPDTTFQPYTHAKAQVLFIEKTPPPPKGYTMIMATARKVGRNSRGDTIYRVDDSHRRIEVDGKPVVDDDLPLLTNQILKLRDGRDAEQSSLGFTLPTTELERSILIPRYYDKNAVEDVKAWAKDNGCTLVTPRKLLAEGVISVTRGHGGVGKQDRLEDGIPYIHTSNIGSLEVELFSGNVVHTSEALYKKLSERVRIRPHDLIFVKRGEKRIGNVAIVYPEFDKFLVVAEVDVVRVIMKDNSYDLTPFGLLYLLTHAQVRRQFENKEFYETIIWNIADRWLDVLLPIPKDDGKWSQVQDEVREAVRLRADGLKRVLALTHEDASYDAGEVLSEVERGVMERSSALGREGR